MKRNIKRKIPLFLLALEVFIFSFYYYFGLEGISNLQKSKQGIALLESEIQSIMDDIFTLEKQIASCNVGDFYREKIAREQLQMAAPQETIYYIS